MSGIKIANGTAASAEVTVDTNGDAHVRTPITETLAGFVQLSGESDAGSLTGARLVRALDVSQDYRARVGMDTPLFSQAFEGTVVAQDRLQQAVSTMTITQASGFLILNTALATANTNAAQVRTYRTFTLLGNAPLYGEFWLREDNETATNAISEWGFGYVAGVAAPTDGVFFRRLAGGQLRGVINFAGAETPVDLASPTAGATHYYIIVVHNERVEFWIDNVLAGSIATPVTQAIPMNASSQPMFARVYNTGVASAGRRIQIGFWAASVGDLAEGKMWQHVMAGIGCGSYQIQPGTASGQTALYSPTAVAAPTWTANTAPATNALGGQWISPSPIPAGSSGLATIAETHYPIFAYLNPAGTATLPGKTLYVTGVRIGETFVTVVLGASATVLQWGVACGSTAPSLATTDAATTLGPRRVLLGAQSFAVTAAVGTVAPAIDMKFDTPLVVPPGTYFHVILANFLNAATGALHGSVSVNGYYE